MLCASICKRLFIGWSIPFPDNYVADFKLILNTGTKLLLYHILFCNFLCVCVCVCVCVCARAMLTYSRTRVGVYVCACLCALFCLRTGEFYVPSKCVYV